MCAVTVKVIRKDEQKTTKWSGGFTTQLAIWPEDADFAQKCFGWRMSTATVEAEESVFTKLPGIHRSLMLLQGELILDHETENMAKLKAFDKAVEFEGDWNVSGRGKCVDFNLMNSEGYAGKVEAVPAGGMSAMLQFSQTPECWKGVYSMYDGLTVKLDAPGNWTENVLNKGDFLLFSYTPNNCGEIFLTLKTDAMNVPAVIGTVWVKPAGCTIVWTE